MTIEFTEGFDKYGPTGTGASSIAGQANFFDLLAGEWTTLSITVGASASNFASIVAPLNSNGNAMRFLASGSAAVCVKKTLAANYSTIIGGCRFNPTNGLPISSKSLVMFLDNLGNIQAAIGISAAGNIILFSTGGTTVLATSSASIVSASTHYLDWSIVPNTTGAYTIYLDGVSVMTGTGNFKGGTAATYNQIAVGAVIATANIFDITIDDLYVDDGTGAPLLTNPVVETHFATSDSAVTFAIGAAIFGAWGQATAGTNAPGANELFLRQFTAPTGGATLNSVSCYPAIASATAKFKACVYSDSAGVPGTRLGVASVDTVGTVLNTVLTSTLGTPVTLTAGTLYWIGFITDTSAILNESDTGVTGSKAANTYTSGAPATAPTMTIGQPNWMLWGNLTGTTTNTYEVSQQPPPAYLGDYSYVQSSTVGNEDLFGFSALSSTPAAIYAVAVKAIMRDSDAGARTVTLRTKSGGTDGSGSLAAVQPTTTYAWLASYFPTDPNTGSAWTGTAVNAATSGYKIAT